MPAQAVVLERIATYSMCDCLAITGSVDEGHGSREAVTRGLRREAGQVALQGARASREDRAARGPDARRERALRGPRRRAVRSCRAVRKRGELLRIQEPRAPAKNTGSGAHVTRIP